MILSSLAADAEQYELMQLLIVQWARTTFMTKRISLGLRVRQTSETGAGS